MFNRSPLWGLPPIKQALLQTGRSSGAKAGSGGAQLFLRNHPFECHDIAPETDPDRLKAGELQLLLWRRGVQQIYPHPAGQAGPLAAR